MAELFGSSNPLLAQLVASALPKSNSKKPNKSTGVTPRTITPAIVGDDLVNANARRSKKDIFSVNYYIGDENGKAKYSTFTFALLPAIDHIVNYSASGPFRGNESVPEVKPGIPIRTAMKHRNTVIPGGTNVVQTIGIDSKHIVLVGAFVGTEKSTSGAPVGSTFFDTIYQRIGNPKEQLPDYNSYKQAMLFNKEVVEKGAPVNITIQTEGQKAEESIKVTGVIVDFRLQAVRKAKTYYAMTVLYTSQTKPNSNNASNTSTTKTTQKASSNVPASSNPTASTSKTEDLKTLPAAGVIKKESLNGGVWNENLAKKLKEVYGFSTSEVRGKGEDYVNYTFRRKDSKELDDVLHLDIEYKERNGVKDWYIIEVQ